MSWVSVLPPIVALGASVALKQVIIALLLGVWSGCLILAGGNPVSAAMRTFDSYLVGAFNAPDHAGVLLFTFLLGGTIGVVQKAGGGIALARLLQGFMSSARRALVCAWALCMLIFFDDYSSVLIVGNSIGPALDQLGAPPERLGLIVHVMGVALTSLSPVSSWIGLQIGNVAAVYKQLGLPNDPFVATMRSIPYRFLPLLLLVLVPILLASGRDIGPMADYPLPSRAPERTSPEGVAATSAVDADTGDTGPLVPKPGTQYRAVNALLPFSTIALGTFGGMIYDGVVKIRATPLNDRPALNLVNILSASNSVNALVWSSAAGWLCSMALVITQGVLTLEEAVGAWVEGMKDVLEPIFVLLLAWALGDVIAHVKTADFLASALTEGLPRWSLPALVAILAHTISYACGSSFGTMGIILPLVGPLAYKLGGGDADYLLHCIGSVLGGAIFGNICSPISDTTILTVLATKCGMQAHIATITPYALLAATLALVLGDVPVALKLYGPLTGIVLSAATMAAVIVVFGKRPSMSQ